MNTAYLEAAQSKFTSESFLFNLSFVFTGTSYTGTAVLLVTPRSFHFLGEYPERSLGKLSLPLA